ncbi:hypothetical protein GCM10009127_18810 [Alteraurantiacibacter aestuarii]|uniref:hypothetical protein n=1 Tax=Alteraurantiacibacter aestuarii TaxID=650004 RepID=UPI0031D2EFE4
MLSRREEKFTVSIDEEMGKGDFKWIELLANGLTFDLSGLAPGTPHDFNRQGHKFGFESDFDNSDLEALSIRPGPHLTSGGVMIPVIRCLAWLAAQMSGLPGLKAIVWNAARTTCEPAYFHESVMRWISGGPFPGFGLTALVPQPDGAMISEGLTLFTGQELRLDRELASDKPQGAKVALRLIHWLVENGRIEQTMSLTGPSGETLVLEPVHEQGIVNVWRGSR